MFKFLKYILELQKQNAIYKRFHLDLYNIIITRYPHMAMEYDMENELESTRINNLLKETVKLIEQYKKLNESAKQQNS